MNLEEANELAKTTLEQLSEIVSFIINEESKPNDTNQLCRLNVLGDNHFTELRSISNRLRGYSRVLEGINGYGIE